MNCLDVYKRQPRISAKSGLNVEDVLEMIVKEVPAPSGNINHPTQALIFDSFYDSYRGVVVFVRIKEGSIKVGEMCIRDRSTSD